MNERLAEELETFRAKWADVINDLAVKYGDDLSVAEEKLKAIARATILDEEPQYSTDLDIDLDDLVADYVLLRELSM